MNKVIFSVIFAFFFTVGAPSLSFAFSESNVIFELVKDKDKDKKKKGKKKKNCCAGKEEAEEKKNCCAGKEKKKSCSGEQKEQ